MVAKHQKPHRGGGIPQCEVAGEYTTFIRLRENSPNPSLFFYNEFRCNSRLQFFGNSVILTILNRYSEELPLNTAPASPASTASAVTVAHSNSLADPPAPLTLDQFRSALPDKVRKSINQDLVDQINATLSNPDLYESYRDNLLSYTRVMADGRFKVSEYINAVRYVSHKLMGCTNIEAYSKTFPEKIQRFSAQGVSSKDVASYVTAYNKSKLVNLIFEQTLVPSYVLNQDLYQKALNVQAELMINAASEKVRTDAANSLLTHLKMPETQKVELDIKVKEDSSIHQLREATLELARQQRLALQAGQVTALEVAHTRIVPKEVIDVEAIEK